MPCANLRWNRRARLPEIVQPGGRFPLANVHLGKRRAKRVGQLAAPGRFARCRLDARDRDAAFEQRKQESLVPGTLMQSEKLREASVTVIALISK